MIRDLHYPADAQKEVAALCEGLAHDAAIARSGIALSDIPPLTTPDFRVPLICGGIEHDQAVRREASALLSRLSFISMISRFEVHAKHLLLQRRVLEHLKATGSKMDPPQLWRILTQVQSESRSGPVKMCGLIVTRPSASLKQQMDWLDGLYRVRNCLAHRLGNVEIVDVKPVGLPLEKTKDSDTLKAIWLRPRVLVDGIEVQLPYQTKDASEVKVDFSDRYVREWKIGEQIDVSPLDCQAIALTLSILAQQLVADFEAEMNVILGIPST